MKMADSSSRKRYIAILCFAAVAVLVAGVLLRPAGNSGAGAIQTRISFNSS